MGTVVSLAAYRGGLREEDHWTGPSGIRYSLGLFHEALAYAARDGLRKLSPEDAIWAFTHRSGVFVRARVKARYAFSRRGRVIHLTRPQADALADFRNAAGYQLWSPEFRWEPRIERMRIFPRTLCRASGHFELAAADRLQEVIAAKLGRRVCSRCLEIESRRGPR